MVYNGTETLTFLGPKIWEMVSDYIRNSNSLEEFKLKIKLSNPGSYPCKLCKRFLPQVVFFRKFLLVFYGAFFVIFLSRFFLFCF